MTPAAGRIVVVGGGILGTMHAIEAVRRGYEVLQLERHAEPEGASVRNFGLIWVGGRAPGDELEAALRARERWEAIAAVAPGTGFRPSGSLTVAETPGELAVLEEAAALPDAGQRRFRLLGPDEAREHNPGLTGSILGALLCELDAIVEPRTTLGALRGHLALTGLHRFLPGREVVDIADGFVRDQSGAVHRGDLVVCCPGAEPNGVLAEALDGAPLRRVRLQMLETEPHTELTTALANGESLRYYPAYRGRALEHLRANEPHDPLAVAYGIQLLVAQRLGGHLTIGDTHLYEEPLPFDTADRPTEYLLGAARRLVGGLPPVERRWLGTYVEVTDPRLLYYRAEVAPGVVVVTGPGGRGMTLSPAIADDTFS